MFRDFSSFEIEDFAFDESFQKWVTDVDSDHRDFWERYMSEHPHQIDKVLAARELVMKLASEDIGENREMADIIWVNVKKHIAGRRKLFSAVTLFRVAAAVVLLVVTSFVFYFFQGDTEVQRQVLQFTGIVNEEAIEHINRTDSILTMVLADGSSVHLEKNSRIVYSKGFHAKDRVLHLHGEAFFNIRKDPKHPFIIFANKAVVKVLGTSFRVKAYDNSTKVVVSVKTGKVSVFDRKDFGRNSDDLQMPGLVLAANQQAEFSAQVEKFSKMVVPDPQLLGTANKKEFDFDQTPLPRVFETLEKAYGIEIIYDRDFAAGRLVKISLEDESLFEKLDLICKTMGLKYHVVDARIIIENQ